MEINFKDFKDRVRESLAGKAYNRLEEIYKEFSSNIFEDNEEDFEEYPNSDKEVQGPGGEFLVDLEFKESDTKLKNFRVVAINKEDALSRLNNMFGKKSFEVTKIELEPNYDYKKTDKMLGRVVKESEQLEESKKHIETASDWHGGRSSPLYSFASTGGKVHSEVHRKQLNDEIKDNINHKNTSEVEKKKLNSLLKHVNSFKVKESLEESLSLKNSIKTWIDDFISSDNPRFEGKSKEDRRQMAIAAYMSKKNDLKESKKEVKKAGRKLKGIMTDPTYNSTDPKNTSSFKAFEPVSEETSEEYKNITEGAILKKILKNKKHGN